VKESGPLPKHFIEQIPIPMRVRFFNNDDHLANSLNNLQSEPQTPFTHDTAG
jgi:hypothetical protein